MKKLSIAGLSVFLAAELFCTAIFCTVGKTQDVPVNFAETAALSSGETEYIGSAEQTPAPEGGNLFYAESADTTAAPESYEQFIQTSWWKANLSAYTSIGVSSETQTALTSPETTTSATSATTKATTTTPPPTTTTPQTTTTTPPPTTTTPATTTTQTTTTAAQTTAATAAPKDPSASDETLSYSYNGSKYRGNAFDVVCQVVTAEMGSDFHVEALKAQAVATYTYIKYNNAKGVSPSVSLKTNVPSKVSDAVRAVFGLTAYYNGAVAQTVYCSSSGGATASAANVWGSDIAYLRSVPGDYDNLDRYYGVIKTFTEAEVRSIIESTTGLSLSGSPANWFAFLPPEQGGVLDGGYVGKMLIDGNSTYTKNGSRVQITGRVLRENIFAFRLNSSKFTVSYEGGKFIFTTYGYGHGVGMSQHGANLYASQGGYSYLQILQHYYSGITVS